MDGNDPLAVYEATKQAVNRARAGEGPTLLELLTYRITGHSRRDPCLYQPKEERQKAAADEPIGRFEKYLLEQSVVSDKQEFEQIGDLIDEEIEKAVTAAMAAPDPQPEDALADMFVESV